ncbi:Uncharacterised protein [Klebsiella pneumoniae]|uniref:Uncharacterized protein n=1 Tax=Klebsiella pneumoniae TaxID=573 RepID=A0A377W653_KLEPN|nr:Uncharacterised protein [Klebsiella pneumoniae]
MPGAGRQACRFKVTAFVAVRQHNLPNRQSVAQAPHRFRVARCPSTGLAVRRCFLSGADIASYPGLGQSRAAAPLPRPARTEPEWCFCDGPTTAQIQASTMFLARASGWKRGRLCRRSVLSNRWLGLTAPARKLRAVGQAGKAHRNNSFAPPWCRTFTMPPPVRHTLITLTT